MCAAGPAAHVRDGNIYLTVLDGRDASYSIYTVVSSIVYTIYNLGTRLSPRDRMVSSAFTNTHDLFNANYRLRCL